MSGMEEQRQRIGSLTCQECHQEVPLYEGQKRKYCDDCLPIVTRRGGKLGGRPSYDKHVCANCNNYRAGLCVVREWGDMERGANSCNDWQMKE